MERTIENYLAARHILVGNGPSKHAAETLFAIGYRFNVHITEGREMADVSHIRVLSETLGYFVSEPFYRGFPESVRRLGKTALYLDRVLHYAASAGLLPGEVVHHSVFEEELERSEFVEKTEENAYVILPAAEARARLFAYLDDATKGSRPLSDEVFSALCAAITTEGYRLAETPGKNTRIRLLAATRDLSFLEGLSLCDVLKVTEYVQAAATPEHVDMKKLALPARDRRFIATLLDILLEGKGNFTECYEKKKLFCGLLHHIHYKAKCENGTAFLAAMRGKGNLSAYSRMERAMAEGDVKAAVDVLLREKGGTALLRHLNYLLSRARSAEEVEYVMAALPEANPIVYIQLLHEYAAREKAPTARSFIFPHRGLVRTHTETDEEVEARRSFLPDEVAGMAEAHLRARLAKILKGRLGRVYIDPAMHRIAVPLSEGTSQGGLGVLPKGSRLPLPEGSKLRAFTYWEQVNDIDLSVQGLNVYTGQTQEFSWRTFLGEEAGAIVFSGDQTDGYHGGSEFFDVDLPAFREEYPHLTHLVFCNAVYSQKPFSELVCRAGYMIREREDSGEVFEPKTVKSSFTINCESTEAYLFGLDLETAEIVWLNLARESCRRISGESSLTFLNRYFKTTSVLSLGALFELLATEVVERPEDADLILSDDAALTGDAVLRSYDVERVCALLA